MAPLDAAVADEGLRKLDELMMRLIQADQTGNEIDPLEIANELGAIRAYLVASKSVVPREGGQNHFRCEACGAISHGDTAPAGCPSCGGSKLFRADRGSPTVGAGPA